LIEDQILAEGGEVLRFDVRDIFAALSDDLGRRLDALCGARIGHLAPRERKAFMRQYETFRNWLDKLLGDKADGSSAAA
jgi:hypothetical protein